MHSATSLPSTTHQSFFSWPIFLGLVVIVMTGILYAMAPWNRLAADALGRAHLSPANVAAVAGLTVAQCHGLANVARIYVGRRFYGIQNHAEARQSMLGWNEMVARESTRLRTRGVAAAMTETVQHFVLHENLVIVDAAYAEARSTADALAMQTFEHCALHLPR